MHVKVSFLEFVNQTFLELSQVDENIINWIGYMLKDRMLSTAGESLLYKIVRSCPQKGIFFPLLLLSGESQW